MRGRRESSAMMAEGQLIDRDADISSMELQYSGWYLPDNACSRKTRVDLLFVMINIAFFFISPCLFSGSIISVFHAGVKAKKPKKQ
jgi:hypothetical protein